ncbi:MAG TPA: LPXTG cell wall anchor domain-containing protein [Micromonosporaceae bacterium]
MASRRASLSLRLAILAAACGLGVTAAASGAAAAESAAQAAAQAKGTVKIDGIDCPVSPSACMGGVDDDPSNEPHVGCRFAVQFFNFESGATADIRFDAQPPSGTTSGIGGRSGVSAFGDPASETFGAGDLNFTGLEEHPKQGFHVKLTATVTAPDGEKVFEKHKVFWTKCAQASPSVSPSVSPTRTTKPPTPSVTTSPPSVLPVTGTTGIGGLAAIGLALVAGGTALMLMRRRRDNLSSTD